MAPSPGQVSEHGPEQAADEGSARLSPQQIAEAFSRHDFEAAIPYLAPDVQWDNVGTPVISGPDQVAAVCRESGEYLQNVQTAFRRFRSVGTDDCVVTDSLADYTEPDGAMSTVASCDLYTFADGQLTEIRSYTVEVST